MNIKKNAFSISFVLAMLASCAALAPAASRSSEAVTQDYALPMEAPAAPAMEKALSQESASGSDFSSSSTTGDRLVIRNANLSIVVEDPIVSMDAIGKLANSMGGFIVNSNTYKTTTNAGVEVPVGNITVRVPVEKLDTAISQIKSMVEDQKIDILNEEVSGQDVTSEVTDLESRLRNLKAAEEQLLQIMDNASKTEDVISVFRELTNVRGEIEVLEGQIKYYRESASLSAISVSLQAKAAMEPITIAGWQPGIEVQKAIQALVDGGKYLVNALIWLVLFALPLLAVIILPVFFIVKAIRKRQTRKAELVEKK